MVRSAPWRVGCFGMSREYLLRSSRSPASRDGLGMNRILLDLRRSTIHEQRYRELSSAGHLPTIPYNSSLVVVAVVGRMCPASCQARCHPKFGRDYVHQAASVHFGIFSSFSARMAHLKSSFCSCSDVFGLATPSISYFSSKRAL